MNSANYFVPAPGYSIMTHISSQRLFFSLFFLIAKKKQRKNKIHLSSRITKIKIF